jgi:hypothetical protein
LLEHLERESSSLTVLAKHAALHAQHFFARVNQRQPQKQVFFGFLRSEGELHRGDGLARLGEVSACQRRLGKLGPLSALGLGQRCGHQRHAPATQVRPSGALTQEGAQCGAANVERRVGHEAE